MSNTATKTGGPSGLPYMGDKVTLIRDVIDLAADTDEYDWEEVSIAWDAIVSALRAAKALLVDIEAMQTGNDDHYQFGPFGETVWEHEGIVIEWPNLDICAAELSKQLHRLK